MQTSTRRRRRRPPGLSLSLPAEVLARTGSLTSWPAEALARGYWRAWRIDVPIEERGQVLAGGGAGATKAFYSARQRAGPGRRRRRRQDDVSGCRWSMPAEVPAQSGVTVGAGAGA